MIRTSTSALASGSIRIRPDRMQEEDWPSLLSCITEEEWAEMWDRYGAKARFGLEADMSLTVLKEFLCHLAGR